MQRACAAKGRSPPMNKSLRLLVLSGAIALSAAPVFADGPGGTDPPPTNGNSVSVGTVTGSSSTDAFITALLAYLGL